jgi:hypothetical protein
VSAPANRFGEARVETGGKEKIKQVASGDPDLQPLY